MHQAKQNTTFQQPSQNLQAEESLIATIMYEESNVFESIKAIVQSGDFYNTHHKLIFRAIEQLSEKNEKADILSIGHQLKANGELKNIGGGEKLVRIVENAPLSLNPETHARIIKDCSINRQVAALGSKMIVEASSGKPASNIIQNTLEKLEKIEQPKRKISIISAADVLKNNPQQTALIDGFINQGEGLIIHAAGGVGKSMISLFLAVQAGKRYNGVEPIVLFDKFEIKKQMSSLFIQSENSASAINTRLSKMAAGEPESLENIFFPDIYNDILTTGKSFEDPAFIQHCINTIHTIEDKTGQELDLFIVDPLISFHNGDENDSGRMRACLDGITELSQRTQITPIVLHHNNRSGEYRGSSAVYDWARNMVSLKRIFIAEERITDYQNGIIDKRTARVPAIEIEHQKANNLPLFEKFTIVMDLNFRFSQVENTISPDMQERCNEVAQALKDLGDFAESNNKLAKAVSELTGRSLKTCKRDIAVAVENKFIQSEKSKKGNTNAYCYSTNK